MIFKSHSLESMPENIYLKFIKAYIVKLDDYFETAIHFIALYKHKNKWVDHIHSATQKWHR